MRKRAAPGVQEHSFQGLDLRIEFPRGGQRPFTDDRGKTRYKTMYADYGEVLGTRGLDGEPVDVYVGPDKASTRVFVVTQMRKGDWTKVDEEKIILGVRSSEQARSLYRAHYDDPRFLGGVKELSMDAFKQRLAQRGTVGTKIAANAARIAELNYLRLQGGEPVIAGSEAEKLASSSRDKNTARYDDLLRQQGREMLIGSALGATAGSLIHPKAILPGTSIGGLAGSLAFMRDADRHRDLKELTPEEAAPPRNRMLGGLAAGGLLGYAAHGTEGALVAMPLGMAAALANFQRPKRDGRQKRASDSHARRQRNLDEYDEYVRQMGRKGLLGFAVGGAAGHALGAPSPALTGILGGTAGTVVGMFDPRRRAKEQVSPVDQVRVLGKQMGGAVLGGVAGGAVGGLPGALVGYPLGMDVAMALHRSPPLPHKKKASFVSPATQMRARLKNFQSRAPRVPAPKLAAQKRVDHIAEHVDDVGIGIIAAPYAAKAIANQLEHKPGRLGAVGRGARAVANHMHRNENAYEIGGLALVAPSVTKRVAQGIDRALPRRGHQKLADLVEEAARQRAATPAPAAITVPPTPAISVPPSASLQTSMGAPSGVTMPAGPPSAMPAPISMAPTLTPPPSVPPAAASVQPGVVPAQAPISMPPAGGSIPVAFSETPVGGSIPVSMSSRPPSVSQIPGPPPVPRELRAPTAAPAAASAAPAAPAAAAVPPAATRPPSARPASAATVSNAPKVPTVPPSAATTQVAPAAAPAAVPVADAASAASAEVAPAARSAANPAGVANMRQRRPSNVKVKGRQMVPSAQPKPELAPGQMALKKVVKQKPDVARVARMGRDVGFTRAPLPHVAAPAAPTTLQRMGRGAKAVGGGVLRFGKATGRAAAGIGMGGLGLAALGLGGLAYGASRLTQGHDNQNFGGPYGQPQI